MSVYRELGEIAVKRAEQAKAERDEARAEVERKDMLFTEWQADSSKDICAAVEQERQRCLQHLTAVLSAAMTDLRPIVALFSDIERRIESGMEA